jgi:hypothetical protein
MIKVRELAERLLVLQPRFPAPYLELTALHAWSRNEKALREVDAKLRSAELEMGDLIQKNLDLYLGKYEEEQKRERKRIVGAREKLVEEMRKKKTRRGFAVAATGLCKSLLNGETLGERIDAEHVVRLAEEARAACDCMATAEILMSALLHRAHTQLIEREQEYKQLAKRARRSLDSSHLIAVALSREGKAREAALAHPDVKRACQILKDQVAAFPDEPGAWKYVMLQTTHPETAAKVAEALRKDEVNRLVRAITVKLNPVTLPVMLEHYWELKLNGKEKEGLALLRSLGQQGVPLPFDVEG